jgi:gliding motility-associated lipoprotein GldD
MKNNLKIFVTSLSLFGLTACNDDDNYIPKPSSYLNTNFPEHSYVKFDASCPYTFDISKSYTLRNVYEGKKLTCHKDIVLGTLNGTLHFSYIDIEKPLSEYINFSINKVDEHKIKASAIEDRQIINKKEKVYGTLFELQGNVASPFQFYLTDSISRFVSGVVYFNSPPNYDSIKPSLDYLKFDLERLFSSFKWKY